MTDDHRPDAPASSRPAARKHPGNDEPEIGFEESVPSDGKDPLGEKMIEDLGRVRPEATPKGRAAPGAAPKKKEKGGENDGPPEEPPPEPMPKPFPVS